MVEPTEMVIICAQQNFEIAGGLNPVQIEIEDDRILNMLKRYKNLNSKLVLGRLKVLFHLAKMTPKSIKYVETAIVTGMGLNTSPHQKSQEPNLPNITGDIIQNTTNQLMTAMLSPKLSNCMLRVSGQDG